MINRFAKMRDSWFTKIILTVTALSFMSLFGVSGYINSAANNKAVIQVDDIQITQSEFSYMLQREMLKLRNITGALDEDAVDEMKAKVAQVLANSKLNDAILENMMKKHKVDFSPNTVGQIITLSPEFNNNGTFDRQAYKAYLSSSGKSEKEVMQDVKRNMARRLLVEMPVAGAKVPAVEQKQMEKVLGQRRTFKYVRINTADAAVTRQPSTEDLDQIYDDLSEELTVPEKRDVSVMYLPQEAIENTIEVSPEEIESYYKEHITDYEQPEQRNVLQMVFDDEDSAKAAYGELSSGIDFTTVAAANGQNPQDIKLGYVGKNDLSEDLAETVFTLANGAVSAPTQIADSWQIVQVTDIKAAAKTDKTTVIPEIITAIRQEKAYDGNDAILAEIEDKLGAGTPLNEIAATYNTPLLNVSALDETGVADVVPTQLKDVVTNRDFIDTVFSYNEGETTQTVETDEGLAVAVVNKIYDTHKQPREEADALLRKIWSENERAAVTQEEIDNIQRDSEAGDDLPTIAKRYGLNLISSRPLSRAETLDEATLENMKDLFSAAKDEPIVLNTGDDYLVAATTNIYDDSASLSAQEKDRLKQILYNNIVSEMSEALLKDFASRYKVKVEHGRIGLNNE
ncbi:MAG: SurA N-terminal domain-containing protein [Alphaproteobacteria bacterium]|nr:SurA N-terminal domain-containing protein [Alphaproteobacteria bacterium]